jgi:RimJ/RimL family protein N-acetyltransferase
MADLVYRPLAPEDLPDLIDILSEWEVVRQLGSFAWPLDHAFVRSRCQPYQGHGFVWGICLHGRLAGTVGVTDRTLGYMLAREMWGQGIMSKAARDAVDHAFDRFPDDRLEASIWADNVASRSVLGKLGFQSVLTETCHAKARNEMTASESFVLSRARWQDLSNARQSATAGA